MVNILKKQYTNDNKKKKIIDSKKESDTPNIDSDLLSKKCDLCDNYLDEFSENGTCFDCLMNSCIAGQYKEIM